MINHGLILKSIHIILWFLTVNQLLSAESYFTQIRSLPGFSASVMGEKVTPGVIHNELNTIDNEKLKGWDTVHNEFRIFLDKPIDGFRIDWAWFDPLIKINVEKIYLIQERQRGIIQHDRDEFLLLGKMINENDKL